MIQIPLVTPRIGCLKENKREYQFAYIIDVVALLDKVFSEAVVRKCSVKKVFLEISQNSLENTCDRDSF